MSDRFIYSTMSKSYSETNAVKQHYKCWGEMCTDYEIQLYLPTQITDSQNPCSVVVKNRPTADVKSGGSEFKTAHVSRHPAMRTSIR